MCTLKSLTGKGNERNVMMGGGVVHWFAPCLFKKETPSPHFPVILKLELNNDNLFYYLTIK